ncbi:MAG: glycerol-3-phosphate dehydrogenase/oxidase [Acidobacteria bacterium]|nr:glycerol-3-phosphate dehydrogenase/oxidase [Acidobacteriota bacterium]
MKAPYDIIIIGGGINGCALARHAAFAGFSVALVEKNDFGSGVTSRATRLIHGGLRYLESFDVGLVRESLRDRRLWIDEFPGQATPLRFLIPVYGHDRRAPWYIRTGLAMYGMLAGDPRLSEHRAFSTADALAFEPALDGEDLSAAFLYWDGQSTWPERVSLEMALQAEEAGATIHNHFEVEGLLRVGDRIVGVRSGEREIEGRLVINAAGAWIDGVRALLGAERRPLLTRLNGAHIIVEPFEGAPRSAVYHEARSDGRPFFIVPCNFLMLTGTTETPYDGDPDCVLPLEGEIEYLVAETNLLFPGARLRPDDIAYAYAGSRPLVHADGSNMNAASRDHQIHDHWDSDGVDGLLTLVGGKLTTAPSFAAEALEAAARKLGRPPVGHLAPQPAPDGFVRAEPRLARLYGPRTPELLAYLDAEPGRRRRVIAEAETTVGEIAFAIEREKACTLGDILLRRTMLAFRAGYRPEWAETVSREAADWLQWSDSARIRQLADFQGELERTLARS